MCYLVLYFTPFTLKSINFACVCCFEATDSHLCFEQIIGVCSIQDLCNSGKIVFKFRKTNIFLQKAYHNSSAVVTDSYE